jgi:hypothetical protein
MKRVILFVALLVFFSCLAVIYTYPLIKYTHTGMPYTSAASENEEVMHLAQGDYIQLHYYMWLFKDALLGRTPLFVDPYQLNVPEYGLHEHFNYQYIPLSFLYAPLALFFGDVAGYNLLIMLTFPLAGIGFYLLSNLWLRSFWPTFVGSVIYTIYPYRLAHILGGHPGGFTHSFIPWIFYFYILGIRKKQARWGFLSGLCFLGLGLNEFHVAYYIPIFLGGFFILPLFYFRTTEKSTVSQNEEPSIFTVFKHREVIQGLLWTSLAGLAWGLFLYCWFIRRMESPFLIFLIPGGIVFAWFSWVGYAWLAWKFFGLNKIKVLSQDLLSFLPFVLLFIYPVQFLYDVPGLADHLVIFVFGSFLLIKGYFLFKDRETVSNYRGVRIGWERKNFYNLLAFAVPAFLLVGYLMFENITKLNDSVVGGGRSLGVIKIYSPYFSDVFIRFNSDGEKFVYPGLFTMLLILPGFFIFGRKLKSFFTKQDKFIFAAAFFLFFLTFFLSFGPRLDHIFPLYNFFHQVVWHFNYIRVPTRIIYVSFFLLSLLAAFGLRVLFQMLKKNSPIVACILLIAIGLDYYPEKKCGISIMPQENSLYDFVKKNIGSQRLLELPIWPGESSWSSIYQWYATRYRLAIVNGYRPAISLDYVNKVFKPLSPLNQGKINEEMWNLLKAFGVKYIILHEEAFPTKVSPFPAHFSTIKLKESIYLKFIRRDQNLYLFEVAQIPNITKDEIQKLSPVCTLMEAEYFKRRLGEEREDLLASNQKAVAVFPEVKAGWWMMSKPKGYPSGNYKATIRLKIDPQGKGQKVLRFEVWDYANSRYLLKRIIKRRDFRSDGYEDFDVLFKIQNYTEVEFRIFYHGNFKTWMDVILLGFQLPDKNIFNFEAEELWHSGIVAEDTAASGGEAVEGRKGSPSRDLMWGPYRIYPPGHYKARFWFKASPQESKDIQSIITAVLLVSANYGKEYLSQKSLRIKAIQEQYQPFELDFELQSSRILEFTVRFEGNHSLWIDRVEVEKIES